MLGSGDRAGGTTTNNNSTSSRNSSSGDSGPGSERRNCDFSISAILSDDTGRHSTGNKRRRGGGGVREQRSRSLSGPVSVYSPPPPGTASLPLSTPSRFSHRLYSSPHPSSSSQLTVSTPNSHWVGSLNQSVSLSPFNVGHFLPLSPSPSSTGSVTHDRLDLDATSAVAPPAREGESGLATCNDSLGMLSTVAALYGEMSGGEGKEGEKQSNTALSVGDGMAQMRLESSSDTMETTLSVEERCCSTPPHPPSPTHHTVTTTRAKGRTPCILKRDRKRPRQLADSFPQKLFSPDNTTHSNPQPSTSHPPPSQDQPSSLNTGFLSPTSTHNKSPQNSNLSFSPSIFLSHPAHASGGSAGRRRRSSSGSNGGGSSGEEIRDVTTAGRGAERRRGDSESDGVASVSSLLLVGGSEGGMTASNLPSVKVSRFVTSTPIKYDVENVQSSSGPQASPSYLSPSDCGGEVKRPRLRDVAAYETSSGSDSEAPPPVTKSRPRSQGVRRRNKARTQLSPLLENACSPITKNEQPIRPPSSLLTANFPISSAPPPSLSVTPAEPSSVNISTATVGFHHYPLTTPTAPRVPPPVPFPFIQPQVPAIPFQFQAGSAQYLSRPPHPHQPPNLYMGIMSVPPAVVTTCSPLFPVPLSPPNTPYFVPPHFPTAPTPAFLPPPPNQFYYSSTPCRALYGSGYSHLSSSAVVPGHRWGSSPLSTQIEKTGQIQSVPPWFIFEQNRPEGKRLRLTEAINRSLSETPSHNPKLPMGWTKYACGQTDDQVQLTQRARQFLQSGRRQLTFDNIST